MTGPHDSVIGVRAELAIQRMRTGIPVRFHPADGDVRIEGVLVECDLTGGLRTASRCASTCRSHGENDHERDPSSVPHEHEPTLPPERDQVPIARREPEVRRDERGAENAPAARPIRPATSGTSGTSQMRNCGESTFPKATKTTTEPAQAATSRAEVADPRAKRAQIPTSAPPGGRSDGRDVRQPPGEVLGAVRGDDGRVVEPELVGGEEHGGAEALDLERPAELALHGVDEALGPEEGERQHDQPEREREHPGPIAAPSARASSPGRSERREKDERIDLRRDRDAEDREPEALAPRRGPRRARRRQRAAGQRS